jgi:hypothetical protein
MQRSQRLIPARALTASLFILLAVHVRAAFDPASLPEVGYHPGGLAYWATPYFANALAEGGGWLEYGPGQWGTRLETWNNPQFDANGYPQYLNPGKQLRAITYALHTNYGNARPATWPVRSDLARGHVVLTWKGNADVRLPGGTFLAGESSGAATGSLIDGRRSYRFTGGEVSTLEVHAIDPAAPITDIKVWLADPADPDNRSLEGELFHPTFLERLREADWGFIRFMDWLETNASPQRDWSDRRPPTHMFMTGALNPRPPADGFGGDRGTGVALEMLPALCNAAGKDMWVCVPHMATDDYVRKLARLIRYGSDGSEPYDHAVGDPVWAPLEAGRRVFIEYSNEIWSNGNSFAQGNWAEAQAQALGITKAQFNARRYCQVWRIFAEEFGGTDRLVRVAAVFTAGDFYTRPFLQEMAAYGPTLTPPVEPDVIAATTYFGNGIQDYVYDEAKARAETEDPWFMSGATFDAGGGNMRPVTLPAADPYWTGEAFERHQKQVFDEWKRRLLAGDAREGAGPDAVGIGGGFDVWLADMARTTFASPKPIIAYEGGPSIYTDNIDGGDARDDGTTIFMEALNRRPEMAEVYRIHLNMAKSKGLRSHVGFVDCGSWGKYGQWGHLEYLDQPTSESVKFSFLVDWSREQSAIREVDDSAGAVPSFATGHNLPVAVAGQPYAAEVAATGGDGARAIDLIGKFLVDGLRYDPQPGDPDRARIAGTPAEPGINYVYLRVLDADGDPAWRTFTLRTVGGPETLVEVNLDGANPARHLPWASTYVLADGVGWSGVGAGTGIVRQDGDNAIVWSVNAPANEADATLALAVNDGEYLTATLTPPPGGRFDLRGADIRFTIRRIDYHAPRRYAVMTSIGGFAAEDAVFTSPRDGETADANFVAILPDTPEYAAVAEPFEVRIVGFSGQYGGHKTSLVGLKIGGKMLVERNGVDVTWNLMR